MTIEEINQKKQAYESLSIIGITLLILGIIIGMAMSQNSNEGLTIVIVMMIAISGFLILLYASYKFTKLKKYFKNQFVKDTFEKEFPHLTYTPNKGFDEDEVFDSGVLQKATKYTSEDYIEGSVSGYPFESADVHIQQLVSTGKSAHYVTVFQGRFYKIHMQKEFPANVYILPKTYNYFKLIQSYKNFDTESIEFSKAYKVYSSDHLEALKIVKPVVMDRLLSFKDDDVKKLMFGFIGSTLYMAIDNRKDNFDIKLFSDIDVDIKMNIESEMALTSDLIELVT